MANSYSRFVTPENKILESSFGDTAVSSFFVNRLCYVTHTKTNVKLEIAILGFHRFHPRELSRSGSDLVLSA